MSRFSPRVQQRVVEQMTEVFFHVPLMIDELVDVPKIVFQRVLQCTSNQVFNVFVSQTWNKWWAEEFQYVDVFLASESSE